MAAGKTTRPTTRAKKTTRPTKLNLARQGARIVSVDGPFNSRVLVDMPADLAHKLFDGKTIAEAAPSELRESAEHDLALLAERDASLAKGTLAATARALAIRLENPYTSATAAAMCGRGIVEIIQKLHELAPPAEKKGALHGIRSDRAVRLVEGQPAP